MNTHPQPSEPTSSPWTELYQDQAEAQASKRPIRSKAAPQPKHADESEATQPTHEALHSIYNHD